MLLFRNKGLIPEAAITTMGVNAKVNDNPIGQFGTGLKYAIAIILRLKGTITIYSGNRKLVFGLAKTQIRKQEFNIVTMNGRKLGFTDQLGLNWEPWMAYRELASNVRDEGGTVRATSDETESSPEKGYTRILVDCAELERAHHEKHTLFIQTEPMYTLPGVEVHAGESKYVFYRGIRAMELQKKSKFTYNLTRDIQLTEDRTILYPSLIPGYITRAIIQSTSERFLHEVLHQDKARGFMEESLPYANIRDTLPTDQFMDMVETLRAQKSLVGFAVSVYNHFADLSSTRRSPYEIDLNSVQLETLRRVLGRLADVGILLTESQISFKSNLNLHRVQATTKNRMAVDHKVLDAGEDKLALTLIEGAAYLNGGSAAEQLANFILHKEFIPEELVESFSSRAAAPVEF